VAHDANWTLGVISRRRSAWLSQSLFAAAVFFLLATPLAHAGGRIYWGGYGATPPKISFANLDGSGGGDLNTMGATLQEPLGVTIDPAAGRVYWANDAAPNISFANLDGSGGGDLNTTGATTNPLAGIAIYPPQGRIYWANTSPSSISYANLDGSGGGNLNTGAAAIERPEGVAIDPAAGKIYWANSTPVNKISFANLDDGGGGDLNTGAATIDEPIGVAIDPAAGKIYWANWRPVNKISFANLDGSGGGDLNTGAATVKGPEGVAIDPAAGRIYWANFGPPSRISFANLDGSGGGDLPISGATVEEPAFPALLEPPSGAGPPTVAGGAAPGSLLSCSKGSWAPDLLASFLYRVPQSYSYQWSRGGVDIDGSTSESIATKSVGNYQCRVTARNQAGSASQTSADRGIFKIGRARLNKRKGTARLPVTVAGPGAITLTGKGVVTRRTSPGPQTPAGTAGSGGTTKLLVKVKGKRRKKLNRTGRVKVSVEVTYIPTDGTPGGQVKRIKLRKSVHH
jgi:DNA-binding beta-propeller fold protein YncE